MEIRRQPNDKRLEGRDGRGETGERGEGTGKREEGRGKRGKGRGERGYRIKVSVMTEYSRTSAKVTLAGTNILNNPPSSSY
jgi:hypothetical protein